MSATATAEKIVYFCNRVGLANSASGANRPATVGGAVRSEAFVTFETVAADADEVKMPPHHIGEGGLLALAGEPLQQFKILTPLVHF